MVEGDESLAAAAPTNSGEGGRRDVSDALGGGVLREKAGNSERSKNSGKIAGKTTGRTPEKAAGRTTGRTPENTGDTGRGASYVSVEDMERVERGIAGSFESIARALEEQNRLLRQLVESRKGSDDELQMLGESDKGPKNKTSRLQRMSKASKSAEEDVDFERQRGESTERELQEKKDRKESRVRHGHDVSKTPSISLAQRKREFVLKTAPGEAGRESPGQPRSTRTRLAVAAARREMERGEQRRQKDKALEEEESNSVGSWILFAIVLVLGCLALSLGAYGYVATKSGRQIGGREANSTFSFQRLDL
jgi:hypothetical protein